MLTHQPIPDLNDLCTQVEIALDATATALRAGDAPALQSSSETLRHLATHLANTLTRNPQLPREAVKQVRHLAQALTQQREGLARQVSHNQRTLEALLPGLSATPAPTYSPRGTRLGSAYGRFAA